MTYYAPIDTEKVHNLIAEVQINVERLQNILKQRKENFLQDRDTYGLAEHHFRRALEGILTIGTHILSRLPKTKSKDYQTIIASLGDYAVIPKSFAQKNRKLASYRNRLVHLYWEVKAEELYNTIAEHLKDLDAFCEHFLKYIRKHGKTTS